MQNIMLPKGKGPTWTRQRRASLQYVGDETGGWSYVGRGDGWQAGRWPQEWKWLEWESTVACEIQGPGRLEAGCSVQCTAC